MTKVRSTQMISILAMVVSVSALLVSIRETDIMKEQSKLMYNQNKTSVWPYLTGNQSLSLGEEGIVSFKMVNKGIGPAIVKRINFSIGEEPVSTYLEIHEALKKLFPTDVQFALSATSFGEQIIRSDEEIEAIKISFDRFEGDYEFVANIVINYDICYCSIYDDCWAINDYKEVIECTPSN